MDEEKRLTVEMDDELVKVPTGIRGFDDITMGGLPQGRPTLVAGGPGCGKTLFGMEFLVRGATQFDEPGVCISFEETETDLVKNVKSLGFNLNDLIAREKIIVDYIFIERREIMETGEYDLEGLFVRIADSIDTIGAKRIVLDTLEALFSGFPNEGTLRAEIRRLFRWLKERGITAIVTAEKGKNTLTRHGLEEYISDCVISLDHRVVGQVSTRRLRIVKFRGSLHGTNEYPFLMDDTGISILPITSVGLDYAVSTERVPTGIPRLDTMMTGEGYYRGSSVLVSGTSGTGKTSIAACFADATCRRGEKCLYFAFEESESQIIRNMGSIGLNLEEWVKKGLLRFHASRPTGFGLEMHLVAMYKLIRDIAPATIITDPISNLLFAGDPEEVKMLLMRLIDLLKKERITSLFTSLAVSGEDSEETRVGVSSLMDTWIMIQGTDAGGERNRSICIVKSRGMPHSNQIREFLLTDEGIELVDVYLGPEGVLTGAARASQEARDRAGHDLIRQEAELKFMQIKRRRKLREMRIAELQAAFEFDEEEAKKILQEAKLRESAFSHMRERLGHLRQADAPAITKAKKKGGHK